MALIYVWFLILVIAWASFNKEMIEDILSRTGVKPGVDIVKENKDWHDAQLRVWILAYLLPAVWCAILDMIPEMCEYLIRLFFFALMFIALYNSFLNNFRNLSWDHTGKNDFIKTEVAVVVMIIAIGEAIVYELGGFNFIKFWV